MFIEVEPNKNIDACISQMYRDVSSPREAYCIQYQVDGKDETVRLMGYDRDENQFCPAYACAIEESGDGLALLIFGGNGGLRMKLLEDESDWSVDAPGQWSETHLIYPSDSFIVYKDQI
ncbi:MAG: hypothetical protein G3M78_04310 [Candidatus Nitrohelix vancouverensis]|uniref:Uncharacterized protein n=1 Tax=Candidatus Nitrohelix vancouverensis TaxID=2705534 RepID=A0A7T0G2T9_9BACT|nr:MAG: hypothetical protein G3M78_04310 [Candidatus Nitrohelix vancouverensis]